jgi:2-oxoglutarate dehydrogenase E2 component (dihydrolipoamide succinyltransferase)
MKEDILVPSVGESITGGILTSWIKKEGEQVEEGEDLFELETDKATVAVPAPADGTLHILIQEGQEVEIGQVVGDLTVGKGAPAAPPTAAPATPAAPPAAESATSAASGHAAVAEPSATLEDLSPAVRRIVKEHGLSPAELEGTGPKGRITKEDAMRAAERAAEAGKAGKRGAAPAGAEAAAAADGAGGTESAAGGTGPAAGAQGAQGAQRAVVPTSERQTRVAMSRLRQTIADRLVRARQEIALLTTFNEINMERVIALRKQYGETFEKKHGVRLGFMSFFVKASCQALQRFPAVNAMIDGRDIVYNNFYDIGVAVSTDRGLVVPVLRDADAMSFAEIERTILDMATRARDKKIAPDELAGGTFTITNGGVFGSLLSTPLPKYPQTGILGMHAIQKRAIAVDDQVVIKPMMYVALSYDHRLIDGREAVQFLVTIKSLIEDPQALLLDI